jgi:type I restriction-modification system DNA methylase subunit
MSPTVAKRKSAAKKSKLATLKADYVLANPPFNDGSKGESGWGADRIADGEVLFIDARNCAVLST